MKLKPTQKKTSCKPILFNLRIATCKKELTELIKSNPSLEIIDEIQSQLKELIKLRFPKQNLNTTDLFKKIEQHLDGVSSDEYGIWAYYPWINKLVHILGEKEFIEVRTNRNHYKITQKEEVLLTQKKIGIIGLSVGKAIALTIALERICGELIVADFDEIELSNLNRIQTGVQNLGLKKTTVVAREIAEIDPYLKVTCFHDGLTEENSADFFTKNGKMDICIEVCDGLYSKIFARQKAKELGIAVVMNSSDRGTTDIERFDLNPALPILHGLIDHLDLSLIKQAKTNEEKVPYLLAMLGVETSSERLKASMIEIQESITTWPQLASGVVLGGAICTDVCRRILLNQFTASGRYFVDPEQTINDQSKKVFTKNKVPEDTIRQEPRTTVQDYKDIIEEIDAKYKNKVNSESCELAEHEVEKLVSCAIMAPSGGNRQPWKWLFRNKSLLLFKDVNRAKSILNYKDSAAFISFGAAAENLILKAHEMGYEVILKKFPLGSHETLIASFEFYKNKSDKTQSHKNDHLIAFVDKRVTNRILSERTSIETNTLQYFQRIVQSIKGAELKVFTDPNKIDELKEIIVEVDRLFLTNKAGHSHFVNEVRWNQTEVEKTKDGVDINTLDISPTERAGLIVTKNWDVTKHIKEWDLGTAFGKLSTNAIDSSSGLGMIVMPISGSHNFFDGGRAVQRLWLSATEKGIAFQPMSIHSFLFKKIGDNNYNQIEEIKDGLLVQREKFSRVTGLDKQEIEVFFFRLSIAKDPTVKALRRDLNAVIMKA